MVEPSLGAAKAAAQDDAFAQEGAKVAANLAKRLFGPSADVLGSHWAQALEEKLSNVRKVAELADRRLCRTGHAGRISSRVGASVFDAAQFADDEMVAEYLSGVLASSSDDDASDRGIPWSALIARLSSDALRLHYVLFSIARQVQSTEEVVYNRLFDDAVYVPMAVLFQSTGWDVRSFGRRTLEATGVLVREALIYDQFTFGDADLFRQIYSDANFIDADGGFVFAPTQAGVDLYFWGLGAGGSSTGQFSDPAFELRTADGLSVPGEFSGVGYLQNFAGVGATVNPRYRPS